MVVRREVGGAGVLVGLAVALLVGLCALLAVRRVVVVRLDDRGYQVRLVRGAGVHRAVWKEVEAVAATTVAGARCVVLRLRDGRTTTIPVDVLGGSSDDFVRDLQQHLNRVHGYRPLAGPGRRALPGADSPRPRGARYPVLAVGRCRLVRFMAPAC